MNFKFWDLRFAKVWAIWELKINTDIGFFSRFVKLKFWDLCFSSVWAIWELKNHEPRKNVRRLVNFRFWDLLLRFFRGFGNLGSRNSQTSICFFHGSCIFELRYLRFARVFEVWQLTVPKPQCFRLVNFEF